MNRPWLLLSISLGSAIGVSWRSRFTISDKRVMHVAQPIIELDSIRSIALTPSARSKLINYTFQP